MNGIQWRRGLRSLRAEAAQRGRCIFLSMIQRVAARKWFLAATFSPFKGVRPRQAELRTMSLLLCAPDSVQDLIAQALHPSER